MRNLNQYMSHLKLKLNRLFENSLQVEGSQYDKNVLNFSSFRPSFDQKVALGYGLKFATETSNNLDINSIRNIIKSSKENEGDFAFLVGVCLGGTCNDDQPCAWPERLMLAIESIKRNKDIKVSKSDKTNQLVIMDIDTYRNKMNDLLLDETIYEKLTKNPIKSGSAGFNRKLKNILM